MIVLDQTEDPVSLEQALNTIETDIRQLIGQAPPTRDAFAEDYSALVFGLGTIYGGLHLQIKPSEMPDLLASRDRAIVMLMRIVNQWLDAL